VKAVTLRAPHKGRDDGGTGRARRFDCDLVCIAAGARPADDLAYQATARGSLVLRAGEAAANDAGAGGPWLAGLVAGAVTVEDAAAQGTAAGSAAARASADPS